MLSGHDIYAGAFMPLIEGIVAGIVGVAAGDEQVPTECGGAVLAAVLARGCRSDRMKSLAVGCQPQGRSVLSVFRPSGGD